MAHGTKREPMIEIGETIRLEQGLRGRLRLTVSIADAKVRDVLVPTKAQKA